MTSNPFFLGLLVLLFCKRVHSTHSREAPQSHTNHTIDNNIRRATLSSGSDLFWLVIFSSPPVAERFCWPPCQVASELQKNIILLSFNLLIFCQFSIHHITCLSNLLYFTCNWHHAGVYRSIINHMQLVISLFAPIKIFIVIPGAGDM